MSLNLDGQIIKNTPESIRTLMREAEKSPNPEAYYNILRELAKDNKVKTNMPFLQTAISILGPLLRSFKYEVSGLENIPKGGCILAFNHCNTNDLVLLPQVLNKAGFPVSIMVTKEFVPKSVLFLYEKARYVQMDRTDKDSGLDGIFNLSSIMVQGTPFLGGIAPEATWNKLPKAEENVMRGWYKGLVIAAKIADKQIVPVNLEYVENEGIITNPNDLYKKCVVKFGKPIIVSPEDDVLQTTLYAQKEASRLRLETWEQEGIKLLSSKEHVNHVGIEIGYTENGVKGPVEFNYEQECKSLCGYNDPHPGTWTFTCDSDGNYVPGNITYEDWYEITFGKGRVRRK